MHPKQVDAASRLLRQGQNSRVELCEDRIIIKSPRNHAGNSALLQEAEVLQRLQGLLPLDIPRLQGIRDSGDAAIRVFSAVAEDSEHRPTDVGRFTAAFDQTDGPALRYERLEGRELSREVLLGLTPARREAVAAQLGGFLQVLHGLPPSLLDGLTLPSADTAAYWREFYHKVNVLLFPHFRAEAVEPVRWCFVRHLNRRRNFTVTPAVLHGDFGPTNLLYDDDAGAVRVIDFGSVRLGDPAADIAALMGPFGYGEAFVTGLTPYYPGLNRLMERARFYAQTFALQQALWGLENGDREAYDEGMKKYV